jgi:hypothetical protein
MMTSERRIGLPMFVEIGSVRPASIFTIEEEDHALADVDEKTDCAAAPKWDVRNRPPISEHERDYGMGILT